MVLIDYVVGQFKKLPGGSIKLMGKRWSLVGLVLVPPFIFCSILPKLLLDIPVTAPEYRAFTLIDSLLILIALAFLLWTPRRIVVFDSLLGGVTITHAGLMKEKKTLQVSASDIQEISLVSEDESNPHSRPRLFLKTRDQLVYLVSLGRSFLVGNLVQELQSLVVAWKKEAGSN